MSEEHSELQHHFDTPLQQFEASKQGMWLFLATEVLFFGGLFCLYAVFRLLKPEIFAYGAQFLDTRLGAINTAVLLISSLTMALAVSYAQLGNKRLTVTFLVATFYCGALFMAVKYIEYKHKFHEHLVWGEGFYQVPSWAEQHADSPRDGTLLATQEAAEPPPADPGKGQELWQAVCRNCHGRVGEGVEGEGKDLRLFSSRLSDSELLTFIKVGREIDDPENTTGIKMPPKGGNPLLGDRDLRNIIGFMRSFEVPEAGSTPAPSVAEPIDDDWIPTYVLTPPAEPPAGLADGWLIPDSRPPPHHSVDAARPPSAHIFFTLYFCMTGLHAIHVIAGMAMILWLLVGSIRGRYGRSYFTPIELGGLYWHLVDLVWIFLFPFLYLIG